MQLQGGSNMTGTDFFVKKTKLTCASKCLVIMVFKNKNQSRSYLNHLVVTRFTHVKRPKWIDRNME
jgi:hypothetical protein